MTHQILDYNLNKIGITDIFIDFKLKFKSGQILRITECEKSGLYGEVEGLSESTINDYLWKILLLSQSYTDEVFTSGIVLDNENEFTILYNDLKIHVGFCNNL